MDRNQKAVADIKDEDFKKRVENFMTDYKALTEKHDVDYVQFPMYVPDGKGSFLTVIQNQPKDLRLKRLNDSFLQK